MKDFNPGNNVFNIPYEGTVIRPPSEADSLIFQLTLGCSDNRCIFCPAYKDKPFRIKDTEKIIDEIKRASKAFPYTRKIFFADGDALFIGQSQLMRIFDAACESFSELRRIGIYGSIKSLERKTVIDLRVLKLRKLGIVYLGFETGDQAVYEFIEKYGSPEQNVSACKKVKEAGIKVNVTVILGLGGKKKSVTHALNTAKILSEAQPNQIAALTLMIAPGTALYEKKQSGDFQELSDFEYLEELKMLIENLEDFNCLFFSNHASNYFPISARFPKDRRFVIENLKKVIAKRDKKTLTPEFLRGL